MSMSSGLVEGLAGTVDHVMYMTTPLIIITATHLALQLLPWKHMVSWTVSCVCCISC